MKDQDQILLEFIYMGILESQTRSSESEIKFYLDEVFGNDGDGLEFFKSTTQDNNPKFDKVIFGFSYKGTMYVKVFSGAGEDASKSDSGSLSVSVFISPNKESNYTKKENNAFYNKETKKVNYDPIIRNGKDLLVYVKSVLDEDDRDKDYKYTPVPNKPDTKNKPQPVLA